MKFIPYNFQEYCIGRLLSDKRLALWLDMSLGKTVITLTAINELIYHRLEIGKVLVVAPKKVAEATWQKEIAKWDHLKLLRYSTILGDVKKRIRAIHTPADIYIINRENLKWLVHYFMNDWPYDMLVLDEATSYKSHRAERFKAARLVTPRTERVIELTGTPSPKGLIDLWSQIYLLDEGKRLGQYITHYRERYFNPDKRNQTTIFSYKPKEWAEEAIHAAVSDICVSMKAEDWIELPGRV